MSIIHATSRVIGDVASSEVVYVNGGTTLEITGSVASGAIINLSSASLGQSNSTAPLSVLKIDHTESFDGTLNFNGDLVDLGGLTGYTGDTNVLDWSLVGNTFSMEGREGRLLHFNFVDQTPGASHGGLEVSRLGSEFYITEGALHQPAGATLLNGLETPPTPPPPAPTMVSIHDTTTNADIPDTFSQAYTGPVAGLVYQAIDITPDSVNIMAKADNMFIKTGAGNDAIALHGGTNVVDAGTGSNFLTSGGGFDTFFLDARNIPAAASAAGPVPGAIWDTIQGFGHGDAATLFGIGPGTALAWQRNEGAAGHTGLTLHAILANGATASLTLAGVDNTSHLALSYGQTGGANYLYVKAT